MDAHLEDKLQWLKSHYPDIEVGISTNGQLLKIKKELLCAYVDVLKLSNYGFTKESFENVHRGSLVFEEVKSNIEDFLRIPRGNRPKTIMSFLMLEENKGEENAWKEYWEGKCDELYIWRPHNWAGYYTSDTEQDHTKCRSCGRPGHDFTVRANGDISACCWDFNRELVIGNLHENTFQEIYEGEKLKKIMDMHRNRTFFEHDNLCQSCDQLYDRSDALVYASNKKFKVGSKTNVDVTFDAAE